MAAKPGVPTLEPPPPPAEDEAPPEQPKRRGRRKAAAASDAPPPPPAELQPDAPRDKPAPPGKSRAQKTKESEEANKLAVQLASDVLIYGVAKAMHRPPPPDTLVSVWKWSLQETMKKYDLEIGPEVALAASTIAIITAIVTSPRTDGPPKQITHQAAPAQETPMETSPHNGSAQPSAEDQALAGLIAQTRQVMATVPAEQREATADMVRTGLRTQFGAEADSILAALDSAGVFTA